MRCRPRRLGPRVGCVVICLLALGCAPARWLRFAPAPARAQISLELWQGFTRLPATPMPEAPRVELLLDVTLSMRASTPGGPSRHQAAREAAAQLVARLPPRASIGVGVLGLSRRGGCSEATRVASGQVSQVGDALTRRLRGVEPGGEGSVADSLQDFARVRGLESEELRVVVLTDLDDACGGDLCAAAAALVETGAKLELVLFGDTNAPACLAELSPPSVPFAASLPRPPPLRFRVHWAHSGSETTGGLLARGTADGRPVDLAAGLAVVVVEMEPPLQVGPMLLAPDTRTYLRLLDFPTLEPSVREWNWEVKPLAEDQLAEGS